MPDSYNVTLKSGSNETELERAKEAAKGQGGVITNEFKLIKGFTWVFASYICATPAWLIYSVKFDKDSVRTLQSNPHVDVEHDGQVKTQ